MAPINLGKAKVCRGTELPSKRGALEVARGTLFRPIQDNISGGVLLGIGWLSQSSYLSVTILARSKTAKE